MAKRHRNLRRKPMFAPLLLPIAGFALVALGVAWFLDSQATTTMILVSHAELDGAPAADTPLSDRGQVRAELLARTLLEVDVIGGVDAIYAFPFEAAEQTARPLARHLELPINPVEDAGDLSRTMERIVDRHKGKIVLVVSEGHLLPDMTAELGGHKGTPPVAADEHANIYVLSIPWFGKTKTLRFQYGLPWPGMDAAAAD